MALEHAVEDDFDNSNVVKMLLEKGAEYSVIDEVSYIVFRQCNKITVVKPVNVNTL